MRLRRTLGDLEHIRIFFVMFLHVEKRLGNLIAFLSHANILSYCQIKNSTRENMNNLFFYCRKILCRSNETRPKCLAKIQSYPGSAHPVQGDFWKTGRKLACKTKDRYHAR